MDNMHQDERWYDRISPRRSAGFTAVLVACIVALLSEISTSQDGRNGLDRRLQEAMAIPVGSGASLDTSDVTVVGLGPRLINALAWPGDNDASPASGSVSHAMVSGMISLPLDVQPEWSAAGSPAVERRGGAAASNRSPERLLASTFGSSLAGAAAGGLPGARQVAAMDGVVHPECLESRDGSLASGGAGCVPMVVAEDFDASDAPIVASEPPTLGGADLTGGTGGGSANGGGTGGANGAGDGGSNGGSTGQGAGTGEGTGGGGDTGATGGGGGNTDGGNTGGNTGAGPTGLPSGDDPPTELAPTDLPITAALDLPTEQQIVPLQNGGDQQGGGSSEQPVVPEPGAFALAAVAALSLGIRYRSR